MPSAPQGGRPHAELEGAVSPDPSLFIGDSDSKGRWKKYEMIALGLLGGNLLVRLVLLGLVTICARGMRAGSASPRYKHLRLPKIAEDDYERGAMGRYSD